MRTSDERPSSGDPANAKRSWGETREQGQGPLRREATVHTQWSDAARPQAEREEKS